MLVQASFLIDFGNSETRVCVTQGTKAFRFNLSNAFAKLTPNYKVNSKYADGKSSIFQHGNAYYANGVIAEREFGRVLERPTGIRPKPDQEVTQLTLNLALIKAVSILADEHKVDPSSLKVAFKVSVLLPPNDHETHEDKMVDIIKNFKPVNSMLPRQFRSNIEIVDVAVYSEALASFFGAFFQETGAKVNPSNEGKSLENGDVLVYDNGPHIELEEVEENQQFHEGYVLVFDIGAGSTDVVLVKDMEVIEGSKETFKFGGNTVQSRLTSHISKTLGFKPPKTDVENAVKEGLLYEGSHAHDVSELVNEAKENYAQIIKGETLSYLENASVELRAVKGLLVCGGGALPSIRIEDGVEREVSPPMSKILVNYLSELAPFLKPVYVDKTQLRYLNINGLNILHKHA